MPPRACRPTFEPRCEYRRRRRQCTRRTACWVGSTSSISSARRGIDRLPQRSPRRSPRSHQSVFAGESVASFPARWSRGWLGERPGRRTELIGAGGAEPLKLCRFPGFRPDRPGRTVGCRQRHQPQAERNLSWPSTTTSRPETATAAVASSVPWAPEPSRSARAAPSGWERHARLPRPRPRRATPSRH